MENSKVTEDGGGKILALAPVSDAEEIITVYTLAWSGDHSSEPEEKPNAQLHSRVFINDREIKCATGITVKGRGGDFMEADIHLCPGTINFVPLTQEEFADL